MNVKNIFAGLLTGIFMLMSTQVSAEHVTYYVNDNLGSPVAGMDSNGNLLWRESYNPYGETRINPEQNKDDIGYTGHQKDSATGLTYMQARYYDPIIGRFYSNDPFEATKHLEQKNIHGFNRYAYGNNNPYKFIDPDGQVPLLVPLVIFVGKEIAAEVASQATGGATDFLSTRRMATKGAKHVLKAMKRGRESEKRVLKDMKLEKNNDKVSTDDGNSIPDSLTDSLSVEIKDTKKVSLTKQLKIQTDAAKASGKDSILVTGKNTHVSGNAKKAFTEVIRRDDLGPKER